MQVDARVQLLKLTPDCCLGARLIGVRIERQSAAAGRMLVSNIACSCGRQLTWRCECRAVIYGPALTDRCSLLDRQKRRIVANSST